MMLWSVRFLGLSALCFSFFGIFFSAKGETVRVNMRMMSGLRYDPVRFEAAPGQDIEIRVQNADITDQPHNLLFTLPGNHQALVQEALALGEHGPALDYIPQSDQIIASLPLLKPGNKDELKFEAPSKPGVYPYVCTFPGHGFLMFGALYVGIEMPPLEEDPNIPKTALVQELVPVERPHVQRIFLPDAGPAAIAVALPGKQNYCWDAGACRLRSVWRGKFIDARAHYSGKGSALARVRGHPFWEADDRFPIRFDGNNGDASPKTRFRGYRLIEGQPEFRYEVDGIEVREFITTNPQNDGIIRVFKIVDAPSAVVLSVNSDPRAIIKSGSVAPLQGVREFSREEAAEFSVVISKNWDAN